MHIRDISDFTPTPQFLKLLHNFFPFCVGLVGHNTSQSRYVGEYVYLGGGGRGGGLFILGKGHRPQDKQKKR